MTIKFIAEVGSNWVTNSGNRSWERAEHLIETAKNIGCWGVKFQLFRAQNLYASGFTEQIETNKKRELPLEWLPEIRKKCNSLNIKFGCTPFNLTSVVHLAPYVDWFKISSFDILREDLIRACMQTEKPLMVSVGLARNEDIVALKKLALETKYREEMILLHSVSDYPTSLKDCRMKEGLNRLNRLFYLGQIERPILGYSDHSVFDAAIYSAVRHGAEVIECHIDDATFSPESTKDLSRSATSLVVRGDESKYGHCWYSLALASVIKTVRNIELASGAGEEIKDQGESRRWMADPEDGMRPLKKYREELLK